MLLEIQGGVSLQVTYIQYQVNGRYLNALRGDAQGHVIGSLGYARFSLLLNGFRKRVSLRKGLREIGSAKELERMKKDLLSLC